MTERTKLARTEASVNGASAKRQFPAAALRLLGDRAKVAYIDASRGFGLVATKALKYGTVVVEGESPLACMLDPGQPDTICAHCWRYHAAVPCPWACGLNYCSDACMRAHVAPHELLCTGRVDDETHALVRFKRHAMETNPVFLQAANLVALLLMRPAETSLALENFARPLWHEAVHGDEALKTALVELAEASRALLVEALTALFKDAEAVAMACSPEAWSRILGCFERNQFVVQFSRTAARAQDEEEEEEDTTGTGLFSLLCQANHACEPNAEIVFDSSNAGQLVTLLDVAEG